MSESVSLRVLRLFIKSCQSENIWLEVLKRFIRLKITSTLNRRREEKRTSARHRFTYVCNSQGFKSMLFLTLSPIHTFYKFKHVTYYSIFSHWEWSSGRKKNKKQKATFSETVHWELKVTFEFVNSICACVYIHVWSERAQ